MLNLHYNLDGGMSLTNGRYQASLDEFGHRLEAEVIALAEGDLDADGDVDGASVVVLEAGGSGSFFYLALLENTAGSLKHVKTANLGDRLVIESLEIEGGEVALQMLRQGPGDPQCCPSMRVLEQYSLTQADTFVGELYPDWAGSVASTVSELAYATLAIASALPVPVDGERVASALQANPRMHLEYVHVRLNSDTDGFTLTAWKPESIYSYGVSSSYVSDSFVITRERRSE
jgi:hypothetical protein